MLKYCTYTYVSQYLIIIMAQTGDNEGEGKGNSLGSDDEELSLVDKQVESLKREEIMEAKR